MDMDIDVDAILPDEMKNIFDHSDFMTSEFFDSVMSMEKEDIYESRYDDLMSAIKSEDSSSTRSPIHDPVLADPVTTEYLQSNQLFDNVTIYGKENDETIPSKEFLPLLKQNNIQNNINDILGLQNKSSPVIIRPKKIVVQSHSTPKKVTSVTKKPQVLRIQSISGNGRPLLLPVNVKNVKKYRVINASNLKVDSVKVLPAACQSPPKKLEYALSTSSESTDDIDVVGVETSYGDKYPPLQLTAEEKRLLMKDGITLPTHYPLSKHDEKELKRIRRKIRNKISAQDSRKRKKEYVDQLEEKARKTDEENEILKKKVKYLNKENTKLHEQLKKLQDILFSSSNKATPTTCLMIVLFSTLLVCLPNLRPANNKDLDVAQQELVAARRALLFNQNVKEEEDMSIDEFLVMKKEEAEAAIEEEEKENGTGAFIKYIGDLSKKYEALIRSNCTEILQGGSIQDFCKRHEEDFKTVLQSLRNYIDKDKEEKKFIEPDISDEEDIEDDDLMKKLSGLSNFNENRFKALEIEFASTLENNSLPVKQK